MRRRSHLPQTLLKICFSRLKMPATYTAEIFCQTMKDSLDGALTLWYNILENSKIENQIKNPSDTRVK